MTKLLMLQQRNVEEEVARACCIDLYAVLKIRGKKKIEPSILMAAMKHCISAMRQYTAQTL